MHRALLTVEPYLHGVRVDSFLVKHFRNYTPFRMARIVRAGAVTIDDATAVPADRVFRGQRVGVKLLEPPDKLISPEPLPLSILHEDDRLLVVDKPAGWICHPVGDVHTGTLANAVQHHLDARSPLPGLSRPGIVHRLDRLTSGTIAVAKDHLAHRLLSIAFQQGRVEKTYLALVEGTLAADDGLVDRPIGLHPNGDTILMSAAENARHAKGARTRFRVLERCDATTLVEATPLTGRPHQIRVHFAAIGHPVVGDEFYGSFGAIRPSRFDVLRSDELRVTSDENGDGTRAVPSGRHALHALRLAFAHPITGERIACESPLPADFLALASRSKGEGDNREASGNGDR
ncbi:MAG: RluA family pseudouridine synthase [Planctomycetaceae bacterium]